MIGGTGATGKHLLAGLIKNNNCEMVTSIGRRPVLGGKKHDKLLDVVIDNMSDFTSTNEYWKDNDVFFNCIGTTRRLAGSAKQFVDIEYGISNEAAKMAANANIPHASLISAKGANDKIWSKDWIHPLLYIKTIGMKEQTIISNNYFSHISIFQPGMLIRLQGNQYSWYENFFDLTGLGIRVDILALAMMLDADRVHQESIEKTKNYFIGNSKIKNCIK